MRWLVVCLVGLFFFLAFVGSAYGSIATVTRPSAFKTLMWLLGFVLLVGFGWVVLFGSQTWRNRKLTSWLLLGGIVGSVVVTCTRLGSP